MAFALCVLTASAAAAPAARASAGAPTYNSAFSVHTVEVDDTLGKNSVYQTIAEDSDFRRSFMSADGVLAENAGILEQVRRCDLNPTGYFLNIAGAHGSGTLLDTLPLLHAGLERSEIPYRVCGGWILSHACTHELSQMHHVLSL